LTDISVKVTVKYLEEGVTVAGTITRAQLTEAVYQEVGLSRNESSELVESLLSEVSAALVRGEMVKFSSFGSFSVRDKNERIGRNPKTGEEVPIVSRRVITFRASQVLKSAINVSGSSISDTEVNDVE
jgi:integration host factor subunit alpha